MSDSLSKRAYAHQQRQHDAAWRYFEFHADQRIKVFQFYIAAIGAVFAGLGIASNTGFGGDKMEPLTLAFGLLAVALVSLIFMALDARNQYLIGLAEDELVRHERQNLFADMGIWTQPITENLILPGLFKREAEADKATEHMCLVKFLKHGYIIPGTHLGVILASGIWAGCAVHTQFGWFGCLAIVILVWIILLALGIGVVWNYDGRMRRLSDKFCRTLRRE